jgi:hypothetical protein
MKRRVLGAALIGLVIAFCLGGTAFAQGHHHAHARLEEKVCEWASASVAPIGMVKFSRSGSVVVLNVSLKFALPNARYTVELSYPGQTLGCEGIPGSFPVSTNAKGAGRGTGSFTVSNPGILTFYAGVHEINSVPIWTHGVSLSP